jgi:hypothetical protein
VQEAATADPESRTADEINLLLFENILVTVEFGILIQL